MEKKEKSDKNRLIANQQLEIQNLINELEEYKDAIQEINNILYAVGGPLNDNTLKYDKKQLETFFNISNICKF